MKTTRKSANEINEYEAAFKLNKNNAPGSDGLTSEYYEEDVKFSAPLTANLYHNILEPINYYHLQNCNIKSYSEG